MNKNLKHKGNRVNSGVHFMLGNYAVVEGALAAGCDYFAGYPLLQPRQRSHRFPRHSVRSRERSS